MWTTYYVDVRGEISGAREGLEWQKARTEERYNITADVLVRGMVVRRGTSFEPRHQVDSGERRHPGSRSKACSNHVGRTLAGGQKRDDDSRCATKEETYDDNDTGIRRRDSLGYLEANMQDISCVKLKAPSMEMLRYWDQTT